MVTKVKIDGGFMFQELAVITKETNTEMLFNPTGLTKWNKFSSPEETLAILANHEVSSFMNVLEICRILYEAKTNWRDVNKITTEKPMSNGSSTNQWKATKEDDWDRFAKQLTDTGITIAEVGRMIKIHSSWLNDGLIKKMFVECAYLPTSKTTLYEMATLDIMIKADEKIMNAIISHVKDKGEIFANEVREIKRNKGEVREKVTSSSLVADKTNLKMPSKKAEAEKLNKKWKEVVAHLDAVNELTAGVEGFGIAYESPADVIKKMDDRLLQREKEWTIRKAHSYVTKFYLTNANLFADLKKNDKNSKGETISAAITFNETLSVFLARVTKHKLQKEIERIVKDRLDDVETMKSKGLRANTSFKTSKTAKSKERVVTLKSSSNTEPSSSNTYSDTERKWRSS